MAEQTQHLSLQPEVIDLTGEDDEEEDPLGPPAPPSSPVEGVGEPMVTVAVEISILLAEALAGDLEILQDVSPPQWM